MKLQKKSKGYQVSYFFKNEKGFNKWSDGFNIYPTEELANQFAEKDFETDTHASTKNWKLNTWIIKEVKIWKEEQELNTEK